MSNLDESQTMETFATESAAQPAQSSFTSKSLSTLRENWRNKEHRGPVFFTASSIWLSVAQLLSGLVIVHYIAPREMGLWASVTVALAYSAFLLAGIQNGLSRELPYYIGANKVDTARHLAATTLFYTAGGSVLAFVGGTGAVAFLIWKRADIEITYGVIAVTLLIIFRFYQNYLFVTYRSKNSFVDLARVQFWQGALMIGLLPLVFYLGYGGLLSRFVLVAGLSLWLMHRVRPIKVMPSWSKDSFFLLLKTGIPIFATDYTVNCAATVDKLVLLKYGGMEQVGYYALALSGYAAFQVLPQSIAHYIYPRMSHHYGRTNNPRVLWGMAWKVNVIVLVTMIPVAAIGWFILPIGVKLMFPKYVAGTRAAQIALISAVAYGAATGSNALASLKAWGHLLTYQLTYAALLVAGPFVGVYTFASPLTGVAYGMLGANLIGVALALIITYDATHRKSIHTSNESLAHAPTMPVGDVPEPSIAIPE